MAKKKLDPISRCAQLEYKKNKLLSMLEQQYYNPKTPEEIARAKEIRQENKAVWAEWQKCLASQSYRRAVNKNRRKAGLKPLKGICRAKNGRFKKCR